MSREVVILSAVGKNRVGVLAELTAKIAEEKGNILDIGQKIVGEYFCTLMMVELLEERQFAHFKEALEELSREGDYRVFVQHQGVFQRMHRI